MLSIIRRLSLCTQTHIPPNAQFSQYGTKELKKKYVDGLRPSARTDLLSLNSKYALNFIWIVLFLDFVYLMWSCLSRFWNCVRLFECARIRNQRQKSSLIILQILTKFILDVLSPCAYYPLLDFLNSCMIIIFEVVILSFFSIFNESGIQENGVHELLNSYRFCSRKIAEARGLWVLERKNRWKN